MGIVLILSSMFQNKIDEMLEDGEYQGTHQQRSCLRTAMPLLLNIYNQPLVDTKYRTFKD